MRLQQLLPLLTKDTAVIKISGGTNNRKIYEGLLQSMPTELRLLEIKEMIPYKIIRRKTTSSLKTQYGINFIINRTAKTRTHVEHIGEKQTMKNGHTAQITAYNSATDLTVTFDDGTVREHQRYYDFTHEIIKHESELPGHKKPKDRVGEISKSNQGEKITIIKYLNSQCINVQFEDGTIAYGVTYHLFKQNKIAKPDYKHYKWFLTKENTEPKQISLQDVINIITNDHTLTQKEQYAKLRIITRGKKSKTTDIFVLHKNVKHQIICVKK